MASPSQPQQQFFWRLHGLSSSPMLTVFANGQSGCICYSVYGQHRGLLAARHTCGKQQRWAVSMKLLCTSTMIFHGNAPFGAIYTALRPAFRQVHQVGCLLELLLELSVVPVRWYIVRRACTCMRQDYNLPVAPVMEQQALVQVCIVCHDGLWLIGRNSRPAAFAESCVNTPPHSTVQPSVQHGQHMWRQIPHMSLAFGLQTH